MKICVYCSAAQGLQPELYQAAEAFGRSLARRGHALEAEADALVVLPGGIGTFDEFFEALVLKTLGQLDKPIGVYNIAGKCDALRALLDASVADGLLSEKNRAAATFYADGEALLDAFEAEIAARGKQ
jgi:hypothetical protein